MSSDKLCSCEWFVAAMGVDEGTGEGEVKEKDCGRRAARRDGSLEEPTIQPHVHIGSASEAERRPSSFSRASSMTVNEALPFRIPFWNRVLPH